MKATRKSIIKLPHPCLRAHSKKVGFISPEIQKLVEDMKNATLDWEDSREHEVGVALAAVQMDKLYKLIIIRDDFDDKNNRNFTVFINPVVTKKYGDISEDYEGCLSIEDIYGKVPRHSKVKIKATNLDGNEFRMKADGFLARIFQHEIDHTKGIVFIDHIKNSPKSFYKIDEDGHLKLMDYEKDIKNNKSLWG